MAVRDPKLIFLPRESGTRDSFQGYPQRNPKSSRHGWARSAGNAGARTGRFRAPCSGSDSAPLGAGKVCAMTLIAAVQDGDSITIVSDTKVTYKESAIDTARVFKLALPKILLLRDNLAVAIAGEGPIEIARRLMPHRDESLYDVLAHLRDEEGGGFIVASLESPGLWVVADRDVRSITAGEVALEGDRSAFEGFERDFRSWGDDHPGTRLLMAMDRIVGPLGVHESIGGYCLAASSSSGAFRFTSRQTTIAPRIEHRSAISLTADDVRLRMQAPRDASDWCQVQVLGGTEHTPGAVGIFVQQAEAGRLYPHDRTFEGDDISAPHAEAFIEEARRRGQVLKPVPLEYQLPRF